MTSGHTGLLIIRAWVEDGSSKPLRAHIRLTRDVAAGFAGDMTLADIAAVSATVESWLRGVLFDGRRPRAEVAAFPELDSPAPSLLDREDSVTIP